MFTQGLSGIAKDLTKMSAKSSVKLSPLIKTQNYLNAIMTGEKNAVKGFGFLRSSSSLFY